MFTHYTANGNLFGEVNEEEETEDVVVDTRVGVGVVISYCIIYLLPHSLRTLLVTMRVKKMKMYLVIRP